MTGAPIQGRLLFGSVPNAAYSVLKYLPPGLMLDIGASNGQTTRQMLVSSPTSRVMAFEPFVGNIPLLRNRVGTDPRVTIFECAVSDDGKPMPFYVSATVGEATQKFEAGYSSLGYIARHEMPQKPGSQVLNVKTVAVDDAVGDQPVRFMKIDVQGGEPGVLRSAHRALSEDRIDLTYIEFSGEPEVYETLARYRLIMVDTEYVLIPTKEAPDTSAWDISSTITLSTGRSAYRAWPKSTPADGDAYLAFFAEQRARIGHVQTDLLCATRPRFPDVVAASLAIAS